MEAHVSTTKQAPSTHETVKASSSSSSDAAHRQKGVFAFVYAMESCMNSMSKANEGSAAELEAQSAEANQVAEEYQAVEKQDNLSNIQNQAGFASELTELQTVQTRADITQQNMGIYSTNIANTEQGILTASLNAKTLIDAYSRMGRTR